MSADIEMLGFEPSVVVDEVTNSFHDCARPPSHHPRPRRARTHAPKNVAVPTLILNTSAVFDRISCCYPADGASNKVSNKVQCPAGADCAPGCPAGIGPDVAVEAGGGGIKDMGHSAYGRNRLAECLGEQHDMDWMTESRGGLYIQVRLEPTPACGRPEAGRDRPRPAAATCPHLRDACATGRWPS